MQRLCLCLAALVPFLLLPWLQVAEASTGPPIGPSKGWYVLFGADLGMTFDADHVGALLGGELSMAHLDPDLWYGVFVDGYYDFGRSAARLTFGPEVGWRLFGVDGGPVFEFAGAKTRVGFAMRPLILTVGAASLYGRFGVFGDAPKTYGEVGILLKFPQHIF